MIVGGTVYLAVKNNDVAILGSLAVAVVGYYMGRSDKKDGPDNH